MPTQGRKSVNYLIKSRECSINRRSFLTNEIIRAIKKKDETVTGNAMFRHPDSIKNNEVVPRRRNP